MKSTVTAVLGFLVLAIVGVWQGVRIFENPPTITSLTVWWVLAVLGVGVLTVVAVLAGPAPPKRH